MKLPFTSEEFFGVFAAYNDKLWFVALVLWSFSLLTFVGLIRLPQRTSRVASFLLVVHWAWCGLVYHNGYFSTINPAAHLFGGLFLIEASLLTWYGVIRRRIRFELEISGRHLFSYALVAYSLAYPAIGVPTFGIPCPSTILTIGLFFAADGALPGVLTAIPIVWSIIGGSAAVLMGVKADWVLLFAGISLALYVVVGRRFSQRVSRDTAALLSDCKGSVGLHELQARGDDLPDPVRRYLHYAICEGASGTTTVRLKHGGIFRTKPGQRWFSIRGRQYFTAATPGFVWHASIRPIPLIWITARDCLIAGRGNMLVKLWSVFTIADASGPEIDQGSRLRWLAECAWFPYAFVGDHIEWAPIDHRSARARLRCDGLPVAAVFEFNDEGQLSRIHAERYRDIGGGKSVLTPWGGQYSKYREFGGFLVPTAVDVAWELGTGTFSYARFEVESLEYNIK